MPLLFCTICEKMFTIDKIGVDPYTFKCEECEKLMNGDKHDTKIS